MKPHFILIYCFLIIFLGSSNVFGNSETISLPLSYEGWASLKVTGTYQASVPELGDGGTWYEFKETTEQNGKVDALLVGNYLIYIPAIDKPLVTGTVNYNHHIYRDGKPLTTDIAPPQNITSQHSQGAVGLYINYAKKTYTISIGLGAEGDSSLFNSTGEKVESQTKKRFELEKVELTLPLPQDLKVLKGGKMISDVVKTPEASHKVLKNEKIIEIAWEFIASKEKVDLSGQNLDQPDQKSQSIPR
ncbi:MAG: hypothetical protein ACM3YE_10240 [Bacteroidota bacterium]